jgi:hypothetical protein
MLVESFLKYLDIVLCMESLDIFSAAISEQPFAMKREAGLKLRNMFFQKSVYDKNITTVIRPCISSTLTKIPLEKGFFHASDLLVLLSI